MEVFSCGDEGLDREDERCARGCAAAVACGSGVTAPDAVARSSGTLAGGAAWVLALDRDGHHLGGGSAQSRSVRAGGYALVSACWGHATTEPERASGRYLSFEEREEIAILRATGLGVRQIARELGRDPGTVSRELRRNAATRSGKQEYRAVVAQWKAQQAAKRPKTAKLVSHVVLREYVQERLSGNIRRSDGSVVDGPTPVPWKGLNKPHRADRRWSLAWSPEQISHRLTIDFPDDESMRISPEAIYQSLFIEGRGGLKRELVTCLRTGRALRRPRERSRNTPQGHVTADVVLSERPAEAADRAVPGHWRVI